MKTPLRDALCSPFGSGREVLDALRAEFKRLGYQDDEAEFFALLATNVRDLLQARADERGARAGAHSADLGDPAEVE